MKVKALISFSGLISMCEGEIKEIEDEFILNDLLKVKYIKEVKSKDKQVAVDEDKRSDEINS